MPSSEFIFSFNSPRTNHRPDFIKGGLRLERHPVQLAVRSVEIGRVKEERPHSSTLRGGTFAGEEGGRGRAGARFHCGDTQVRWIWCTGPDPTSPPRATWYMSTTDRLNCSALGLVFQFSRQCAELKFQSHGVIRIDPTSYWIAKAVHVRFQW